MISRMNLVQDAARMAMADHRAASVRRLPRSGFWRLVRAVVRRLSGW